MKVQLRRSQVVSLSKILKSMASKSFDFKIAYAIAKNKKVIQDEVDAIEEASKASPEYEEYAKEHVALLRKHAKKDDKGNPVVRLADRFGNAIERRVADEQVVEVVDLIEPVSFQKEFEELRAKYAQVLEVYDEINRKKQTSMGEVIELDLHVLSLSAIPEHTQISGEDMDALSLFLVDELPPK